MLWALAQGVKTTVFTHPRQVILSVGQVVVHVY